MRLRRTRSRLYAILKRLITPGLLHSQDAYAGVLRRHVNHDVQWLDLGCGHQVLPDWHADDEKYLVRTCKLVVGVDSDLPSLLNHRTIALRVNGDISRLPFRDDCFDLVTANMVVEHLEEPARQFQEIGRILKPGGLWILLTPNVHGYPTMLARRVPDALRRRLVRFLDGRTAKDVYPTYYRANSETTLNVVADMSSFDVIHAQMVTTDALLAVVPPLVAVELVWIRVLMTEPFRRLRPDIVAVLKKRTRTALTGMGAASRSGALTAR